MHKLAILTLFLSLGLSGHAVQKNAIQQNQGDAGIDPTPPRGIAVDEIIRRTAEHESEFARAREQYVYQQDIKVEEMDGDTPVGEYRLVSDITFNNGRRAENVLFAPQKTFRNLDMSKEDFDDLQNRYPFVVTKEELPRYQVLYVGQQKVDELNTYVFDMSPKNFEKGKRYFQGRIWVDQDDLQVVKTYGKPVGEAERKKGSEQEQQFPAFASYREQIDGKYWFPTYARAKEVLHFPGTRHSMPQDIGIRITVKWSNYQRFNVEVIESGKGTVKENEPAKPPKK